MRSLAAFALLALATACSPMPAPDTAAPSSDDSLVLERTRCYGFCPAYQLTLDGSGEVRFQSRNPDDSTTGADRIDPAAFASLLAEAERIGFWTLPDDIQADASLCGPAATDAPTVTITLRAEGRTKRVEHDHGCRGGDERLAALRRFENRVDRVAGSSRWVRPATRR